MHSENLLIAQRTLTANDLGLTGSHQSGFLIPKSLVRGGLFPSMSKTERNPRVRLKLVQRPFATQYFASYIYYNNKYSGGTRDEYRLTGILKLLRTEGFQTGDVIEFRRTSKFDYDFRVIKKPRSSSLLDAASWNLIYGGNSQNDV